MTDLASQSTDGHPCRRIHIDRVDHSRAARCITGCCARVVPVQWICGQSLRIQFQARCNATHSRHRHRLGARDGPRRWLATGGASGTDPGDIRTARTVKEVG